MKKKIISMCLATSMLGSVAFASGPLDIWQESEGLEYSEEIQMEVMATETVEPEILPLEISELDPSKSDRFIVKYKETATETVNLEVTRNISELSVVANVTDIAAANNEEMILSEPEKGNLTKSIELEEKVDIDEFVEQVLAKESDNIEYIQPDYKIDLSTADGTGADLLEEIIVLDSDTEEVPENEVAESVYNSVDEVVPTEIEAQETLEIVETTSEAENEVLVALIDTGVDIYHTELNGCIFANESEWGSDEDGNGYVGDISGWDFYNNTATVYNEELGLDQAHGTHIAGVIADSAPNAKILPLKVFENGVAYTSDIIEAIQYAESMGAKVVNCSWGCTDENLALKEAMENSTMTFVCAAGNNRMDLSETPIYPACYEFDNVISVASVNADGGLSYFSNYGNVDIAALGRDVEGIFPENTTGILSGTSISTGYVTGALSSIYTNREESVNRLYDTADKLLNLQNSVINGRRLNMANLANNISMTEIIDVNPEEDFNTEGYTRTPEDSWELFAELDNVSVKAGTEFLVALKDDGSVWTWGKNTYGELGNGTYTNTTVPQQVPSIANVVEIAAGANHVLARTSSGTVYAWGRNYRGCLGNGTTTNSRVPVLMTNGSNAIQIAAGSNISYVLKNTYELYTCGDNNWGQIGDGTTTPRSILTKVNISDDIVYTSGSAGASYAITADGALYSWGHNGYGRLGDGTTTDRAVPMMVIDSGIQEVSMGNFTALALTEDGEVYRWGYGATTTPVIDPTLSGCTKVVSARQAEFIMQGNTINAKGMNTNGALGVGDTNWHDSWTELIGEFVDFDVAEFWGVAIGTNGCIYTWGTVNADTGEYVTSPMKLNSAINDLAPDEIDDAIEVTTGVTNGNMISNEDVDYYKFTPTSTNSYAIYSVSEDSPGLDLVCKIYTKNSDGSYTLVFSNDDASGTMSSNSCDFYLSKTFNANTDYYIYIYPYEDEEYDYSGSSYELYIRGESNSITTNFTLTAGAVNDVYLSVRNITSLSDRTFTLTYDSSKMQLEDATLFSFNKEVTAGTIAGTGITVVSVSNGQIVFKAARTTYSGKRFTGTANIIRFRALTSGSTSATCKIS